MLPKTPSSILNFEDLGNEIYRYHINWTENFYKNNINIIENNYKKFPNRNRWSCNCHVIHDDDYDAMMIDYKFLRKCYSEIVNNFCLQKNYYHPEMSDIWYNYYKVGQYQEPHIHGELDIVGLTVVHYILYNELYHEPTRFTDPSIKLPEIRQGDFLIFPSNYEHYVLENKSSSPRLTIAFSVTLSK